MVKSKLSKVKVDYFKSKYKAIRPTPYLLPIVIFLLNWFYLVDRVGLEFTSPIFLILQIIPSLLIIYGSSLQLSSIKKVIIEIEENDEIIRIKLVTGKLVELPKNVQKVPLTKQILNEEYLITELIYNNKSYYILKKYIKSDL